jgi:hypothetical protein
MDNHRANSGSGRTPAALVGRADALPARCPIRTRIAILERQSAPGLLRELILYGELNKTDNRQLRLVCRMED